VAGNDLTSPPSCADVVKRRAIGRSASPRRLHAPALTADARRSGEQHGPGPVPRNGVRSWWSWWSCSPLSPASLRAESRAIAVRSSWSSHLRPAPLPPPRAAVPVVARALSQTRAKRLRQPPPSLALQGTTIRRPDPSVALGARGERPSPRASCGRGEGLSLRTRSSYFCRHAINQAGMD
jgi:hypothetical protein